MSTTTLSAIKPSVIPPKTKPRFYVGMAAFMSLLVLVGFWPSYFGQILHGIPSRPWVIHLHGMVFVGWMVLLVAQVILAATGRTQAHRTLGNYGIAYGALVLIMGVVVGIAGPVIGFNAKTRTLDDAAGFLLVTMGDMVLFGGFFLGAVLYRRRPEIHKRLILLATTALLFAAVGRMAFLSRPAALSVWLSPVLIGIAYDAWTRRRVHPAYPIGLVVLLIGFSRLFLTQTEAWLRIGRALIGVFA